MKKFLPGVLVGVFVLTGARGAEDEVKDVLHAIETLNKAFHKGDAKVIKALLAEDHVAVTPYYGAPMTRDEQIKTLPDTKLTEYKAGKMTVRMLGKESALVTYPLTLKGTYKGKNVPTRNYASAVWVKKGAHWLETYYQETSLDAK